MKTRPLKNHCIIEKIRSLGCSIYHICAYDNRLLIELEKMKTASQLIEYFHFPDHFSQEFAKLFKE